MNPSQVERRWAKKTMNGISRSAVRTMRGITEADVERTISTKPTNRTKKTGFRLLRSLF
jgi:hypothetical protein